MDAGTRATMFSSARDDWETPTEIFTPLHAEFGFTFDMAASAANAKCERFNSPTEFGDLRGGDVLWLNPPYGRGIEYFIKEVRFLCRREHVGVCLLPARTDTHWWHEHVMHASEVRLVRGRIRFVGAPAPAPFPSAIVVFRPGETTPRFSSWDVKKRHIS